MQTRTRLYFTTPTVILLASHQALSNDMERGLALAEQGRIQAWIHLQVGVNRNPMLQSILGADFRDA